MRSTERDKYQWYYLHQQGPEELLLLKQFDSATDVKAVRARGPINTSLMILLTGIGTPQVYFEHHHVRLRGNIEVRALDYTFMLDRSGMI